VDSTTLPTSGGTDRCAIPDLRGFTLRQLARQAVAGEKVVTGVVSRIVHHSQGNPSVVPAMMFQSAL